MLLCWQEQCNISSPTQQGICLWRERPELTSTPMSNDSSAGTVSALIGTQMSTLMCVSWAHQAPVHCGVTPETPQLHLPLRVSPGESSKNTDTKWSVSRLHLQRHHLGDETQRIHLTSPLGLYCVTPCDDFAPMRIPCLNHQTHLAGWKEVFSIFRKLIS